jgi:hypothetical protein
VSEHEGDQDRSGTTPFGKGSPDRSSGSGYGQADPYAQPQPYAGQDQQGSYQQGSYGQGSYGQGSYGQGSYGQGSYDQGSYDQGSYGQGPYGQAAYGQPPYQQPAGYAQPYGYGPAAPAKPGAVITSAVFGFIFGALGVLVSGALIIFGSVLAGAGSGARGLDDEVPGLGSFLGGALGAAVGAVVVVGVLALAWTVITIWGAVWALSGRSRVLLIVAGSISIATTGFGLVGNLSNLGNGYGSSSGGSVVTSLVFFGGAVAIVVLLCLRQSAEFFAAHRALRGR